MHIDIEQQNVLIIKRVLLSHNQPPQSKYKYIWYGIGIQLTNTLNQVLIFDTINFVVLLMERL